MGSVARKNDDRAGRVGFPLTGVEFVTQPDIKDSGNYGVDAILWVLVRHKLRAVGRFHPDGVGSVRRGLAYYDGQADGGRECRERLPINIVRQDGFENVLTRLV